MPTQSLQTNAPISQRALLFAAAVLAVLLIFSANVIMWVASLAILFLSLWLVGGRKTYPVLLWIVGMFWVQIAGDLISNDLVGTTIASGVFGTFWQQAVLLSLSALLALAIGLRSGLWIGRGTFGTAEQVRVADDLRENDGVDLKRAVVLYGVSYVLTGFAYRYAWMIPGLTQQVVALTMLKYVCIYLVAAKTFEINRDRHWLIAITLLEFGAGLISFFSTYKEPMFIIGLAAISSRRRFSPRQYVIGFLAGMVVVWVSIIWTVIKQDYRGVIGSLSTEQQIAWISDRYTNANVDYFKALLRLSQRVGYTSLFSDVLAEENSGTLPRNFNFYSAAIQHIITPRIFFPDKPNLDDSRLTTLLLGVTIGTNTSISVGHVTQAYVDFGFPGMLVPMWAIGLMLGFAAQYFMTRRAPPMIRYAFATAALFLAFRLENDIDKALGLFITNFVMLALTLAIVYPALASWLAGTNFAEGHARKKLAV